MINKRFKPLETSVYYNMSDSEKETYITSVKKSLHRTKNEILQKMFGIVERTVKHYHADFYIHDIAIFHNHASESRLLWMCFENGTDVVRLDLETLEDLEVMQSWFSSLKSRHNKTKHIYMVDFTSGTMKKVKDFDSVQFTCKEQAMQPA